VMDGPGNLDREIGQGWYKFLIENFMKNAPKVNANFAHQ